MKSALDGYTSRLKNAHKSEMFFAWHTAAFHRAKKLPALNKVIGEAKRRAQSADEMLAVMQSLAKGQSARHSTGT